MIRLTENVENTEFYFKTMEDCNDFLYVFEDHFCNVPWDEPEEIDENDIPYPCESELDEDPKELAERYLSWGFSLTENNHIGLTQAQNDYVASVLNRTCQRQEDNKRTKRMNHLDVEPGLSYMQRNHRKSR